MYPPNSPNLPAHTGQGHLSRTSMLIVSTDEVPGHQITSVLGLVKGNTVRTRNIGMDMLAGLRNLIGGEVNEYTKMLAEAREQAIDRMVEEAEVLGADAVVGLRFQTSMVQSGAAEMLAYGTAVRLESPG